MLYVCTMLDKNTVCKCESLAQRVDRWRQREAVYSFHFVAIAVGKCFLHLIVIDCNKISIFSRSTTQFGVSSHSLHAAADQRKREADDCKLLMDHGKRIYGSCCCSLNIYYFYLRYIVEYVSCSRVSPHQQSPHIEKDLKRVHLPSWDRAAVSFRCDSIFWYANRGKCFSK